MKFEWKLLRKVPAVRSLLAITVSLSTATGVLIIIQAWYLSRIIGKAFLDNQALPQLTLLFGGMLVVIVTRAALTWGSELAASRIAGRVKTHLRERLYTHLLALGPSYKKGERSGELINTLVEGAESLDAYFAQYLPQLFLTVLVPLIILLAIFPVDVLSGLVLLVTAPLLPIFMILIGMMADAVAKKQWRLLSLMSAHFLDVLQGLTTLKLFGRSKAQQETIARISDHYRVTTMHVLRVSFLSSLVLELGATICVAIVAVEIGLRLLYGQIPFQPAFFVLLLAPEFYLPLRALGARYHAALPGEVALKRINEILDMPVAMNNPEQVSAFSMQEPFALRFADVHYAYEEQRPALNGVSFEIHSGQKIALVGPSGAGKSTIANLLLRFVDAGSGEITINGRTLQDIPAQDWRRQVAWVPQCSYLFNATVAENIRLGHAEATMEEVVEAAQKANAHEFILSLPQGYDTVIGEHGARLSGGQAQRLSLARAFLKNAPLLVLDEATANLDTESEELTVAAIERLMRGHTVLFIAHRLNTVYDADQIIVLDAGKIVETGTHHGLMQRSGLYRKLVDAYAGGGHAA